MIDSERARGDAGVHILDEVEMLALRDSLEDLMGFALGAKNSDEVDDESGDRSSCRHVKWGKVAGRYKCGNCSRPCRGFIQRCQNEKYKLGLCYGPYESWALENV